MIPVPMSADVVVGAESTAPSPCDVAVSKCREAVTCHAQLVEAHDAVVPVVLAARRNAPEQICHLGKLRHTGGDA